MAETAVKLTDLQIRNDIQRRYEAGLPRVGPELDAFVSEQCEYFGVEERYCRRVIANIVAAADTLQRSANITAAQRAAQILAISHVDVLQKAKQLMEHKRRKLVLDGNKNVVRNEDGSPQFYEEEDARVQLVANKQMASFLGTDAPKQVQLEATHEHSVHITDDEIASRFNKLASFFGVQVVDAEFESLPGGPPAGAGEDRGDGVAGGGE